MSKTWAWPVHRLWPGFELEATQRNIAQCSYLSQANLLWIWVNRILFYSSCWCCCQFLRGQNIYGVRRWQSGRRYFGKQTGMEWINKMKINWIFIITWWSEFHFHTIVKPLQHKVPPHSFICHSRQSDTEVDEGIVAAESLVATFLNKVHQRTHLRSGLPQLELYLG